jgi:hypothetical protein
VSISSKYAITVKFISGPVAFSLGVVDLQESYGFECSSRFLVVSTVVVSSCYHLETDMCLEGMTLTNKEGHVHFAILVV